MKKSTTLLSLAFLICSCLMLSCGGEDGDPEPSNDCPTGKFDTLDECNDAISTAQNDYCKCETEPGTNQWIVIFDP